MRNTTKILSSISLALILLITAFTIGCGGRGSNVRYSRQLKPGTPEFYVNQGLLYLNAGDIKMAEQCLKKALKKKSTLVAAINGLGIVYLNKREFRKALDYFRQVTRMDTKYYDAYNYMGVVYTELKEYDLAKENLLRAANSPKYRTPENAYVNLAMLEIRQGRYDAALRYVEKGMEKNERFAPLSNLKGIVLEHQEYYQDAIDWYRKALTLLTEEEPSYLVNIGRVYMKLGRKSDALDVLEKALAKSFTEPLKIQIRQMIKEAESM